MDCSTRPSNVRVCQFRHLGTTAVIIASTGGFVKRLLVYLFAGAAPCTCLYVALLLSLGYAGAAPCTRVYGALLLSLGYAGAAPCTRVRGQPLTTPLGPFHFPRPLEVQVFFNARFHAVMPLLATAAQCLF
jgi:hypothetical protein